MSLKQFVVLLSGAALTSLSIPGAIAQNRATTPYCFVVKDTLSVFSRPANNAATSDRFNRGDIAYATTNPPTTRFDGNRAFVEVAIYGGQKAWLPRQSTIDAVPLIVDLSTDQCTNPPAHAAGGGATGGTTGAVPYCYAVVRETAVFSRPDTGAATGDRFVVGDIAYATTNPPTAGVQGGRSFIEVAIYGGNKAWVPQRSTIDGAPILMDLSPDQCTH